MPFSHAEGKTLLWSSDRRRATVTQLYRWDDTGLLHIEVFQRRRLTDLVVLRPGELGEMCAAAGMNDAVV